MRHTGGAGEIDVYKDGIYMNGLISSGVIVTFIVIALAVVPLIGLWSWWNSKRAKQPSVVRALQASIRPLAWLVTVFAWLAMEGLFSEEIRGVDSILGDSWHVPVQNGYTLYSIDRSGEGGLQKDGGSIVVEDITNLIGTGSLVVGIKTDSSAFSLDTQNGTVKSYKDIRDFDVRNS